MPEMAERAMNNDEDEGSDEDSDEEIKLVTDNQDSVMNVDFEAFPLDEGDRGGIAKLLAQVKITYFLHYLYYERVLLNSWLQQRPNDETVEMFCLTPPPNRPPGDLGQLIDKILESESEKYFCFWQLKTKLSY